MGWYQRCLESAQVSLGFSIRYALEKSRHARGFFYVGGIGPTCSLGRPFFAVSKCIFPQTPILVHRRGHITSNSPMTTECWRRFARIYLRHLPKLKPYYIGVPTERRPSVFSQRSSPFPPVGQAAPMSHTSVALMTDGRQRARSLAAHCNRAVVRRMMAHNIMGREDIR